MPPVVDSGVGGEAPGGAVHGDGLLDQYEELWRGRLARMTALVTDTKETGP